jgi:CheY-like chemotaxis protein/chemotaxis signal transduction protein
MHPDDGLKINIQTDSSIVILPFSVVVNGREIRLYLNVHKVFRVEEADRIDPLPKAMGPFDGTFNLNGLPVPVITLSKHLKPADDAATSGNSGSPLLARLIVINLQGLYFGLLVDKTRKICRQNNASIEPCPESFGGLKGNYFAAVLQDEGGFRYQLDAEKLLADLGITLMKDDGDAKLGKSLQGKRILIVEDSRLFQTMTGGALRRHGAEVDLAANGVEGLALLLDPSHHYDLVLADIEMPKMNGIQMIREYRRQVSQPIPVVFHSSISNPAMIREIEEEGLGEYLLKFEENHIMNRLIDLLGEMPA